MKWNKSNISADAVKALSDKYGCDLLTASILTRRGIAKGGDIKYFLEKDLRYLRNPFAMPGMEDAVERLLAAKEEGEKVMVFGDRDVDGMTGTALLTDFLRNAGFDVRWRLPAEGEPYGLSTKAIEDFAADYGTLIVTVDCGISNVAEIARAAELGVGVVVTDHHNPPEVLPEADALVNPKLKSDSAGEANYGFEMLSGCAVAYKLVCALRYALTSETYGQSISLLNIRPLNDAYSIEIAKMKNLACIDTLYETVVPGEVGISSTRLPAFLAGQQILTWDEPLQQKQLAKIFGKTIEMQMLDIAPEVGKAIPGTAGKSLFRLKDMSRIGRYDEDTAPDELNTLVNLFVSFVRLKEKDAKAEEDDRCLLQFAALGTVADIMPMLDENRLIVFHGLESFRKKPRAGIAELVQSLGLDIRHFTADNASWLLTPAINAAGRMGVSEKAVTLFLSEKSEERKILAKEIADLNEKRKRLIEEVCSRAEPEAQKTLGDYANNFAVYAGDDILPGLTGLVASRLVSRFNLPALVVSFDGDDEAKGSFRSTRGYNLSPLLEQCSDLFVRYGGHDFAAGFSMERKNFEPFLERFRGISASIELEAESGDSLAIDAEIPPKYLSQFVDNSQTKTRSLYMMKLVDGFEPSGVEWAPLVFMTKGLLISELQFMGSDGRHVKLTLDTGKNLPQDLRWKAVYWSASDKANRDFSKGDAVDVVYRLEHDYFNGADKPQMVVLDLRRSAALSQ